jgi:hypothetical protein
MATRKGILPRSLRERYHRSRQADAGEPAAEVPQPQPAPGPAVPQPAPAPEVPSEPAPQPEIEPVPDPEPVPEPEPAPPPEPIPRPEPIPEPEPDPEPEPEPDPEPPPAARRPLGRRAVALAGLVGAILACAAGGIVLGSVVSSAGDKDPIRTLGTEGNGTPPPTATSPRTNTAAHSPALGPTIPLGPGGDYDPDGDRAEHPDLLVLATDGNPSTAWSTEDYQALNKSGVGMYVDPRGARAPTRMTLKTPTPGFSIEVYGSNRNRAPLSLAGWTKLGSRTGVKRTQGIRLDSAGTRFRHVLVWVTALPPGGGGVKLSEVTLRG